MYKDIYKENLHVEFKTVKSARDNMTKLLKDDNIKERINNIVHNNINDNKSDIYNEYKNIITYMDDVHKILDSAAYGHEDAKNR